MKKHTLGVFALRAIAMLPLLLPIDARAADTLEKATLSPSTPVPAAREIRVALNEFKNTKTGAVVTVIPVPEYADAAFYREVSELARSHDVVITDGFRAYPDDDEEPETGFDAGVPPALEERFAQFAPGAVDCLAVNLPSDAPADAPPGAAVLDTIEGRLDIQGVNRVLVLRGRNTDDGIEKKLEAIGFTRAGGKSLLVSITPPASGDIGFSSGVPLVYRVRNSPGRTMFSGPLGCFAIDDTPAFNTSSGLWGLFFHAERNRNEFKSDLFAGILWSGNADRIRRKAEANLLSGLWASENSPEKSEQSLGYGLLANMETRLDTAGATESSSWSLLAPFGKNHPFLYCHESDTKTGKVKHRFLLFFEIESD